MIHIFAVGWMCGFCLSMFALACAFWIAIKFKIRDPFKMLSEASPGNEGWLMLFLFGYMLLLWPYFWFSFFYSLSDRE
jgi:hypothetical protein